MLNEVPPSTLLTWVNEVRIWAGVIAAVAAILTGVATYAQLRLQAVVSAQKDKIFEDFRRSSDERIATAQENAAGANERAAGLEKEAAEAKLALARIQERMAPRRLTKRQADKLAEGLKGPLINVSMSIIAGDPEANAYAEQVMAAMNRSGNVQGEATATLFSGPVVGLRMSKTNTPEAKRLEAALRGAGIEFTFSGATPDLRMSVGTKPD